MPRPAVRSLAALALVASLAACGGSSASTAPSAAAAGTEAPSAAATETPSLVIDLNATESPSTGDASSGPLQSFSVPDMTTLVTADDAATVIGGTPTKMNLPAGFTIPNASVAIYKSDGGTVTAIIEKIPSMTIDLKLLDTAIQLANAQGNLTTVDGLGDVAGKEVTANQATYAFAKGNTIVIVAADSTTATGADLDPKLLTIVQALAGKV